MMKRETEIFAAHACKFCEFVDSAYQLTLSDRIVRCTRHLADLIAGAEHLALSEPDTEEIPPETEGPDRWEGFERFDTYWVVFDPYELAEPVAGSLSDDVIDIYRDLKSALIAFDRGDVEDAGWQWKFGYDTHWGRHAVNALQALRTAAQQLGRDPVNGVP